MRDHGEIAQVADTGERDLDVIVVGAGISGLCAARVLERSRRDVLVLEATERVGGKMRTERLGPDHVDLGAHWIGPGQDRIATIAQELGVVTQPQPLRGRTVLLAGGRRHEYRGSIPLLGLLLMADIGLGTLGVWRRHRGVGFDGDPSDRRRVELDAVTIEQLRDRCYRTRTARATFDMVLGLLLGAASHELSALYALAFFESGGGLKRLTDFKGGAQEAYFVGGAQQICERLAQTLARPVELQTPVLAIEQGEEGVIVHTEAGERRGRYCVLAISPPMAARISYTPALPAERDAFLRRTSMGAYTKAVAVYERPWWREQGLNGIALATEGPVQMIVDGAADSGRGILVGFITGAAAREFSALDRETRRATALDAFAHLLGPAAAEPIDYLDYAWADQAWSRGAPVAHPQPDTLSHYADLPLASVGRLHWAGADLARVNNAYMDGAVESGERAAAEIVARG
jgi:monoamine oxidase